MNHALPSPLLMTLMCDGKKPADRAYQQKELMAAYQALDAITHDATPMPTHWRALADVVEITRQIERMGVLPTEAHADINASVGALAIAGARAQDEGKPIRLPGPYLGHVNGCLEWYAAALKEQPERVIISAVVAVAQRNARLRAGKHTNKTVVKV